MLAADGLFGPDGTFHCMPNEGLHEVTELFRNRFLKCLHKAKLISPKRLANLLSWNRSGFSIHNGRVKPIAQFDNKGRQRLAEYLMRHPFSLQKITWNESTKTVIYRSKRHHNTKRNFEIFTAPDFIAAALLHLPPKGFQTLRYYGVYSNKTRGQRKERGFEITLVKAAPCRKANSIFPNTEVQQVLFILPPPVVSARSMRPLWRDLIQEVWDANPLICPCCQSLMKKMESFEQKEEAEFFLRLQGLWQGVILLSRPPPPPFYVDTMEPVSPHWIAIKEWIPDQDDQIINIEDLNDNETEYDQSPHWKPQEIPLEDGLTLILDPDMA